MLRLLTCVLIFFSVEGMRINTSDNIHSIAAPDYSIFRRDYRFYPAAEGWLKLHTIPSPWHTARAICDLEGARLASPLNEDLYTEMRMLMVTIRSDSIHTGIHTMVSGNDYFSEEGVHIEDLPITWAENEPNNLNGGENCIAMMHNGMMADVSCTDARPFICYKKKIGVLATNECFNNEYTKDNRTNSCYKLHQKRVIWDLAHATCTAEGGHLAVINSDLEAKVLKDILLKANDRSDFLHSGFYNWARYNSNIYSRWSTMDGKTLEEAGFSRWAKGEPNNLGRVEFCGSIFNKNNNPLELNDASCTPELHYICEIDID